MKTKTIEVCDAICINIVCGNNDWDDIKIGGPATLGYEFGVAPDTNMHELKSKLKGFIKKYDRPFMKFTQSVIEDFHVKHLWTLGRMY